MLLGGAVLVYVASAFFYDNVAELQKKNPAKTAFMAHREFEWEFKGLKNKKIYQVWVPLSKISPYAAKAVLIAEDDKFWSHEGFDLEAWINALKGHFLRRALEEVGGVKTKAGRRLGMSFRAYRYWRLKLLPVDLVILNDRAPSYDSELHGALEGLLRAEPQPAQPEVAALQERFNVQTAFPGFVTAVRPAKLGGAVQAPVATAETQPDWADSQPPVPSTAVTL